MTLRPTRILAALTFGLALTLLLPGSRRPTHHRHPREGRPARKGSERRQPEGRDARGTAPSRGRRRSTRPRRSVNVAQDGINRIKSMINGRAASIYKRAGAAGPFDALNAQDAQDLTTRSKYTDVANSNDQSLVAELAATRAELDKSPRRRGGRARLRCRRQGGRRLRRVGAAEAARPGQGRHRDGDAEPDRVPRRAGRRAGHRRSGAAAPAPRPPSRRRRWASRTATPARVSGPTASTARG